MPIRASLRWFYPIDWPQLSGQIRFGRARGRCRRVAAAMGPRCYAFRTAGGSIAMKTAGVTATETAAFHHGAQPSTSCA